ncbi:MAG: T9SS type A sorting domain-containing protein, partial [Bacteroidota bacterium]
MIIKHVQLYLLSGLLLLTYNLSAQGDCEAPNLGRGAFLHANNLRALYAATGSQYWDGHNSQFTFDSAEGSFPTIFAQGLWIGGIDLAGNLKLSASSYGISSNEHDYYPGPLDANGITSSEVCSNYDRAWSVFRYQIEAHLADFADNGVIDNPDPAILGWPARGNPEFSAIYGFELPNTLQGLAPFWDSDADGIYEPLDGEYPIEDRHQIIPEQMVWTIFNNRGNFLGDSGSAISIPTEIQCLAWALDCTDNDLLNNSIFTSYRFIHRGIEPYDSVAIGLWTDFDLGCFTDDFLGSAPALNTYFAYNQDNNDDMVCAPGGVGFGVDPPVQAITFLNQDLAKFIYAENTVVGNPGSTSPTTSIEYYNYLRGIFRDGTPMTFGGTGYNPGSEDIVDHVFPGDPNDPESWSALSALTSPGDRRSVASMYADSWAPGQVLELDVVHSFHRSPGANFIENVTEMYANVNSLQSLYDDNFSDLCSQPLVCDDDCIWSGDLNADGIANHVDVIAFGFGIDAAGSERPGPYNWSPKAGDSWGGTQVFGVDNKHLDANGDGVCSTEDIEYTIRHYNFTKPSYEEVIEYPVGDDITFVRSDGSPLTGLTPGEGFFARTRLTEAIPDLRALAFTLEFDPAFFRIFRTIPSSDNGENFRIIQPRNGLVDYALFDEDITTGFSINFQIYQVTIRDDFPPDFPTDETLIRFRNIRGFLIDGTEIELGAADVPVQIDGIVSTREPNWAEGLRLFPNPVQDQLHVRTNASVARVDIFDSQGRMILTSADANAVIDVQELPTGLYHARIHSSGEFVM